MIQKKILRIAKEIYRAEGIEFTDAARLEMEQLEKKGFGGLPICVAKTQYSFTGDPAVKGACPSGMDLWLERHPRSADGFLDLHQRNSMQCRCWILVSNCWEDLHNARTAYPSVLL